MRDGAAAHEGEFERYLRWIHPSDRVMDIGSGEGRFLEILRRRNSDAFGVDLNDALAALQDDIASVSIFSMMAFVEHIPLRVVLEILEKIFRIPGAKFVRRRLTIRCLRSMFGLPMADMFIAGAKFCLVAATSEKTPWRS